MSLNSAVSIRSSPCSHAGAIVKTTSFSKRLGNQTTSSRALLAGLLLTHPSSEYFSINTCTSRCSKVSGKSSVAARQKSSSTTPTLIKALPSSPVTTSPLTFWFHKTNSLPLSLLPIGTPINASCSTTAAAHK